MRAEYRIVKKKDCYVIEKKIKGILGIFQGYKVVGIENLTIDLIELHKKYLEESTIDLKLRR